MAAKSASADALQILQEIGVSDLPDQWNIIRLESLLRDDRGIAVGVMYPGNHDPAGVPLIKAGDLAGSRIRPNPEFRITPEKHHEYRRTELEGGELLISLVGDVGRCALVPPSMAGWNAARAIAVLRFQSPADAAFVRACLMSSPLQHLMQAWSTTTVQATLNLKEIRQIPLPWPPKNQRDAIAHILGVLDDKIELNRRISETLEAMTQAFFKSWFVDYDPVRAKAEGRDTGLPKPVADLFSGSFTASELGEIPQGWPVTSLGELCGRVAMGPFGSDIKTENFVESGVPVIRGGNLTHGFIDDNFAFVSDQKADELRNANAFPDDIVITHRGTLGQVGLIPKSSRFPRYVVSQSQMVLSANQKLVSARYIFDFLCSPAGQHALLANMSQTGVPAIARPTSSLKAIRTLQPPRPLLAESDKITGPLTDRRNQNIAETRTLAAVRAALLPKLMSGEVRVTDAERFVVAAT